MRETTEWRAGVPALLSDVERFTAVAGTRPLRPYQVEAARAIVSSVRAGRDHKGQLAALRRLLREVWDCRRVAVDAMGVGAGIASWLASELGPTVEQFVFTAPSKSRLAFTLLGMVNTGRCRVYAGDNSEEYRAFWAEAAAARYEMRANEQMTFYVPDAEGHDDFLMSLALCAHAATAAAPAAVVRPQPLSYGD